jgi:GT2 family glycosyltransferase
MSRHKSDSTASTSPLLTVVIVSYNRAQSLQDTLTALSRQIHLGSFCVEVVVVDNASSDASLSIATSFKDVRTIALPTNIGITAFNVGIEKARAPWILVLDDDSYPASGCLSQFKDLMPTITPETAVIACRTIHPNKNSIDSTKDWPTEVITFWGCGAFIHRDTFMLLGGYSPDLFLYFNELDYSLRVKKRGLKTLYDPRLEVLHFASPINRTSSRTFYYTHKNRMLIAAWHYPLLMMINLVVWSLPVTFIKCLFRFGLRAFIDIWRSFLAAAFKTSTSRATTNKAAFNSWITMPIWRDLDLLPPGLCDIPKRIMARKPLY